MLSYQEKQALKKYSVIAGVDEVGRGSLAGPAAAAIVALKKKVNIKGVKDSKLLSAKQREEIFERIKNNPDIEWSVAFVSPKIIDRINIWQATLLTWKRCLKKLAFAPDFLFLDGNQTIPKLKIEQNAIVSGDQKIFLCSLASIIAKVSRDRLMEKLDEKYPRYGFIRHKGYGTAYHLKMLEKYGPSEIHRKSFQPVFDSLSFKDKVYYIVSQIPRGQTATYREVAEKIGAPRAYRAVGNVLNQNPRLWVPCHRVIRSDGKIGGFARGTAIKTEMLKKEGVAILVKNCVY